MCFHTRDAVEREDSSFTFEMPATRLRNRAAKVALASCEFPMTQWTIEEDHNRLWFHEGVWLTEPEHARVRVAHASLDGAGVEAVLELRLPLRLNRAESRRVSGCRLRVRCEHPHGMLDEGSDGHRATGRASTARRSWRARRRPARRRPASSTRTPSSAPRRAARGTASTPHLYVPTIPSIAAPVRRAHHARAGRAAWRSGTRRARRASPSRTTGAPTACGSR